MLMFWKRAGVGTGPFRILLSSDGGPTLSPAPHERPSDKHIEPMATSAVGPQRSCPVFGYRVANVPRALRSGALDSHLPARLRESGIVMDGIPIPRLRPRSSGKYAARCVFGE